MRKYKSLFFLLLGLFIICVCSFLVWFNISEKTDEKNTGLLIDSILVLNSSNSYYRNIIDFRNKYQGFQLNRNIQIYKNEPDTAISQPVLNFDSLLNLHNPTLILRYTEIGCDQCSDLTLKKLRDLKAATSSISIILLVDFTNHDAYLQWRKLASVNFDVYFAKKGDMPMDKDCPRYSYLLNIDNLKVSSCFIPNSGMPEALDGYLWSIRTK